MYRHISSSKANWREIYGDRYYPQFDMVKYLSLNFTVREKVSGMTKLQKSNCVYYTYQ